MLRTKANCLCGLIATMTIAAKIPIAAMTNRISNKVNPFLLTAFDFIVFILMYYLLSLYHIVFI